MKQAGVKKYTASREERGVEKEVDLTGQRSGHPRGRVGNGRI